MTSLIQNQAILVQKQTEFLARLAELDKRKSEMDQRLSEIERITSKRFARIESILLEHSRILEALPDIIGRKIGFKPPENHE